jgi:quinol monooxygenase YgiN
MSSFANVVTIHPYFKVQPGKAKEFKSVLAEFVEKTKVEKDNLYYEFTANGDEFFCREGYSGAEAALAHLESVEAIIQKALTLSEITRLEIHGPASELDKMREPLVALNPAWFVRVCGVEK